MYQHIQRLCTEAMTEALGCGVKQKPNPSANPRHCLLQSNGHREVGSCSSSAAGALPKEHSLLSPGLRVIMPWDIKRLFHCIMCNIQPQPLNCTSINAHHSLLLMALATQGWHLGATMAYQHLSHSKQIDRQSPSSINWEKNISQARDRGDLQQFQPDLAHLRHFNMFSSEDTISMWCQMGTARRKKHT